jgi:cytochrome c biogenesis protein CcdA
MALVPERDGTVSNLLRDLIILGYAGAVGFVAAGIAASFYQWVTSEPARFMLLGHGVPALVTSFAFCAMTGPIIVLDHAVRLRQAEKGPISWLFAGMLVTGLWSVCSGIVLLSILVLFR